MSRGEVAAQDGLGALPIAGPMDTGPIQGSPGRLQWSVISVCTSRPSVIPLNFPSKHEVG